MDNRIVAVAAAAVIAAGTVAGCSSGEPETGDTPRAAGTLAPGTGQATVGGKGTGVTDDMFCQQTGWSHAINIGDDKSSVKAIVSSAKDQWSVESVVINNVGGFSGSYWSGLVGDAEVKYVGKSTFTVTGTATGVNTDNPTQTADGKFEIKANC